METARGYRRGITEGDTGGPCAAKTIWMGIPEGEMVGSTGGSMVVSVCTVRGAVLRFVNTRFVYTLFRVYTIRV